MTQEQSHLCSPIVPMLAGKKKKKVKGKSGQGRNIVQCVCFQVTQKVYILLHCFQAQ